MLTSKYAECFKERRRIMVITAIPVAALYRKASLGRLTPITPATKGTKTTGVQTYTLQVKYQSRSLMIM